MTTPLQSAGDAVLPDLDVDEERDVVSWTAASGEERQTGLHACDLREDPALREYADLLDGPSYAPAASRDGVHRVTVDGQALLGTALVVARR